MKPNRILFLLCLLGLVIYSCKKPEPVEPPVDDTIPTGTLDLGSTMNADFFGKIVDEMGAPLNGVLVTIGSSTIYTDVNGVFKIDYASVPTKLAYIKAQKPGYFLTAESIIPDASALNFVQITMHQRALSSTYNSGSAHTITLLNGVSIDLPATLKNEFGNDYHGQVNVYAKYISSVDSDIDKLIGPNYGQNAAGAERYLESYGMMVIELDGFSGESLRMADGEVATIHMRIDPTQLSNAPSINLFTYFDTKVGYWVEDGAATLNGDQYTGTITHLDMWNIAASYDVAQVDGALTTVGLDTITNFPISMNSPNGAGHNYTNANGTYHAYITASIAIDFSTVDDCGSITPFTLSGPYPVGTASTEDLTLTAGTVDLIREDGEVFDCSVTPVTNGYALVTIGNYSYVQYTSNGQFSIFNINCQSAALYDVIGYDMDVNEQSLVFQKNITTTINLAGSIIACSAFSEYLSVSIDAGPPVLYTSDIYCARLDTGGGWFFQINTLNDEIVILSSEFNTGSYDYFVYLQSNTISVRPDDMNEFASFSITSQLIEWPTFAGDLVKLTFSGFYTDELLNNKTIVGDMILIRDI